MPGVRKPSLTFLIRETSFWVNALSFSPLLLHSWKQTKPNSGFENNLNIPEDFTLSDKCSALFTVYLTNSLKFYNP